MTGPYFILEAEKSSELIQAFRLLAEAGDDGRPRFPADACRAVERAIACRTYAPAVLELCHLSRAASTYRGRYFELFWAAGPMRPGRLRELFATCRAPAAGWLVIGTMGVDLVYPDGHFAISYGRMPVLVALAEFLVTALGFAAVDEMLAPLGGGAVTAADVSRQANALSRAVYDYLKDHLPPLQAQRKLGAVVDFLTARHAGEFDGAMVDDAAVLAFWQTASDDATGQDFRTFTSVFLAFARFRQVLEQAETIGALERATPIGPSVEAGEIDPADIAAAVDVAAPDPNPLDELQGPPSARIKFFNAKERDRLEFLFQCGRAADALPLSFARCEVFGRAQSRITQSLRTGPSSAGLRDLIGEGPAEGYREHQERLRDVAAHGRHVLLAAAHVMHASGLHQVVEAARRLRPDLSVGGLAVADTVIPFPPAARASRGGAATVDAPADRDIDAFWAEARTAAKQIARQGFRPDEIHDDDVKAGFVAGCPLVAKIVDRLESFLNRLAGLKLPDGDWDAQFAADRRVFTTCFLRIYGAAP